MCDNKYYRLLLYVLSISAMIFTTLSFNDICMNENHYCGAIMVLTIVKITFHTTCYWITRVEVIYTVGYIVLTIMSLFMYILLVENNIILITSIIVDIFVFVFIIINKYKIKGEKLNIYGRLKGINYSKH